MIDPNPKQRADRPIGDVTFLSPSLPAAAVPSSEGSAALGPGPPLLGEETWFGSNALAHTANDPPWRRGSSPTFLVDRTNCGCRCAEAPPCGWSLHGTALAAG